MNAIETFTKKLIDNGWSYAEIYEKIVEHASQVAILRMRLNITTESDYEALQKAVAEELFN